MRLSGLPASLALLFCFSLCTDLHADGGTHLDVELPDLTAFTLVRTDAGKTTPTVISVDVAADILAAYDVIFIGEAHRHPGSHLSEMRLFRAIYRRAPQLSLSMEQFERDVQPVVDDYLAGKIGEEAFLQRSRPWGNYSTSYRPLVEFAKEHHLPVIAANAPEDAVRCVGEEGLRYLDHMKPGERSWVAAQVHADAGPYKDKFMGFAEGDPAHGGNPDKKGPPSPQAERAFAAQVARDDTMAESIFQHLQKNPGRKVVHITGAFHSDGFLGTVERLKLRAPDLKIAVVSPADTKSADSVTLDAEDMADGTIVDVIRALPEPYANDAEMKAAMQHEVAAHEKKPNCK